MKKEPTSAMTVSHNIWERYSDLRRKTCMLIITHACNLNCSYCYENHKDNKTMSFEIAKQIISREIDAVKNSDNFDSILIDFMGGEPFMNFPLIKQVVEWIERDYYDAPCLCYATTNGTLIDEERRNWLDIHKDSIILGTSYDGTYEMQKQNRGVAIKHADLQFFHDCW